MLAFAADAGIPPKDFWDLTLREYAAVVRGMRHRRQREAQLGMYVAWHAGAFARYPAKKKLPDLKQLIYRLGDRPAMSNRELRGALLGWAESAGAKVRVVPKGTIARERHDGHTGRTGQG